MQILCISFEELHTSVATCSFIPCYWRVPLRVAVLVAVNTTQCHPFVFVRVLIMATRQATTSLQVRVQAS